MRISQHEIKGKTYTSIYINLNDDINLQKEQMLAKQYPNATFIRSGNKPFKETLVKALESMAF